MFPKYLIGFLGVTTVAGGAAATTFLFQKTDTVQEIKNDLEAPQQTILSTPTPPKAIAETKFEGTLVFKSQLKGAVGRSADVFFQGEIFDKDDYEKRKKDQLEKPSEDYEEGSAEKIEIKIFLPKTKEEIEKYLAELNKKIEDGSKEREEQVTPLNRFEKILKENQSDFELNLGKETYEEVLDQIQKLSSRQKSH